MVYPPRVTRCRDGAAFAMAAILSTSAGASPWRNRAAAPRLLRVVRRFGGGVVVEQRGHLICRQNKPRRRAVEPRIALQAGCKNLRRLRQADAKLALRFRMYRHGQSQANFDCVRRLALAVFKTYILETGDRMSSFKMAIFALALSSCALPAQDFFPLQDGNTWTYREPVTGRHLRLPCGATGHYRRQRVYKLTGYADSDLLVRVEPVHGALVYWDDARNQEILLTSFEQFEGGYWFAPFRPCPEQAGQTPVEARQSQRPGRPRVGCPGDPVSRNWVRGCRARAGAVRRTSGYVAPHPDYDRRSSHL